MNSTTQVDTSATIPSYITKEQVLSFLHSTDKMIALNPLISECNPLPVDRVLSFYESVDKKNKPANASFCKVRPSLLPLPSPVPNKQLTQTSYST